uniref:PH domain-containing protein n=1 Tax=Physcomitrium patens TaxID=3218 RepID=A0A7I4AQU6_PHYPA
MDPEVESKGPIDITSSLEKIKKQLNSCRAGNVLLQGPLLKRSEIIRKWEWRWFVLDVLTGKLEYWSHRGDASPKGAVNFDANSSVTISPKNMLKEAKYDACCFYIITSREKEYFFCAETPKAAEAWVATLRAAVSVLKAHKQAANFLSGNAFCKLENVASVFAAAIDITSEAALNLQLSMKAAALSPSASFKSPISAAVLSASASFKNPIPAPDMDSSDLIRETIKVKAEEIHQLASDLKSRDIIIKELAERLTETAEAAESAASSVHIVNKGCNEALSEVRDADARRAASLKVEETASKEAHRCRLELGKLREREVILEAAMVRVDEDIRRLKVAHEHEIARRLEISKSRIDCTPRVENFVMDANLQKDNALKTADVDSEIEKLSPEACVDGAALLETPQAADFDLRVEERNTEACANDATSQGTSQAANVDFKVDESSLEACVNDATLVETPQAAGIDLRDEERNTEACANDATSQGTSQALNIDSKIEKLSPEACFNDAALLETLQAAGTDLRVEERNSEACANDATTHGTSQAANVDSRVDELNPEVCGNRSKLPCTSQVSTVELAGSWEDSASGLRISGLMPVHTLEECVADPRESVASSPELASCETLSASADSPSVSGIDQHEHAASVCPTPSNLREILRSDDDKVVPSTLGTSGSPAPEMKSVGSSEDPASELKVTSSLILVNTSTDGSTNFTKSPSSGQELVSGIAPCTDNSLPLLNAADNHESAAYVCSITSEFPDVIPKDDMAVSSHPSLFANCGSTITASDCMNAHLKVIGMANESEDHSNTSDGSSDNKNETKTEVTDERNMTTVKSNEMATCLVPSEEKFVVKQEQCKGISYLFSSWWS